MHWSLLQECSAGVSCQISYFYILEFQREGVEFREASITSFPLKFPWMWLFGHCYLTSYQKRTNVLPSYALWRGLSNNCQVSSFLDHWDLPEMMLAAVSNACASPLGKETYREQLVSLKLH